MINNKGKVKSSDERVRMDECWCVDVNRPYPLLKKSVIKVMKLYAKEQKFFSCIHHTDFRLNRYGVGGFMSEHCDNIHHSHGQTYGYPQATVLFFLNDDFDGGDFYVAGVNYNKPKVGSALIFPSNFMFPHEVKKVTSGERWSIVSWLM
jgi:predicted 2-oxoglutarate/Fe(II)-dependent dioxygenase YbiX